MEISEVLNGFTAPSAKQEPPSQELGSDAFMRLLVTQLRFQDPLNPMDNTQFISQLSEFSSLEQLTSIREAIDMSTQASLISQRSVGQSMALGLLGRQIEMPGNELHFDGETEQTLRFDLPESAEVTIEIQDVQGAVVRTLTMGAQPSGVREIVWKGTDDLGNPLPEGNYTYHVLAVGGGNLPVPVQPFFSGIVEGVRLTDEGIRLRVNGQEVPMSSVNMVQLAGSERAESSDS